MKYARVSIAFASQVFIVFGTSVSSGSGLQSEGWHVVGLPGVRQALVNPTMPGHMMTIVHSKPTHLLDLSTTSNIDLISGVSVLRKAVLQQLGFSDWKLSKYDRESRKGQTVLTLSGTYRNPAGGQVQFVDIQFFEKSMFRQYTYSADIDARDSLLNVESLIRKLNLLIAEDRK